LPGRSGSSSASRPAGCGVEVVDAAGAPVATIEISESIAGLPGDLRLEVELWREAGVETSVSRVGSASPAATG
jgi:hypothetical protein